MIKPDYGLTMKIKLIIVLLFTGYKGYICKEFCPDGTYGINCSEQCKCNGNNCSPMTGKCFC